MSLLKNTQGSNDERLENANGNFPILTTSVSNSGIPELNNRDGESFLASVITKKTNGIIFFDIIGDYTPNPTYGNILSPFNFIKIYSTVENKNFIDIKLTKVVGFNAPNMSYPIGTTTIEGILINGNINDANIGDKLCWVFYQQEKEINNFPINLFAGTITTNSTLVSWIDSTPYNSAKYFQVMWRAWGDIDYVYSNILTAIIGKNKYNITGLNSRTNYEWSVMTYFDQKLKKYSKYAPKQIFTTR
jgi:hypothetical protein